jgi:2-amino-4-hydroxy-6-hydroxymethyldihydropteridine diphosphokinase
LNSQGSPVRVVIALGSNLGDRRGHLDWAVAQLAHLVSELLVSAVVETEPHQVPDTQPPYLNAVVVGTTTIPALALLDRLHTLEERRGRTRSGFRAARTLDLDLILYGDQVITAPHVQVPHPRFRERRFVLEPLVSIAPEMKDPQTGRTMAELLADLSEERRR